MTLSHCFIYILSQRLVAGSEHHSSCTFIVDSVVRNNTCFFRLLALYFSMLFYSKSKLMN